MVVTNKIPRQQASGNQFFPLAAAGGGGHGLSGVTAAQNSLSCSSRAMFSGVSTSSASMLPPPSLPGYSDALPSKLLALSLRAASAIPHPKSQPYMSNRGELPIITPLGSK